VRALVTGAKGFVGGHLLPALARAGWSLVGSERRVDVTDARALEDCVARARPDLIVHLAAQSSPPLAQAQPERAWRVNFLGTRAVLEAAARRAPKARVLLAGSGDVYGAAAPGSPPFRESDPLRPRSLYASTKAAADLLGGVYAERGLDVVRLRAFNHTGPGQDERFVLASFAKQAVEIAAGRREPVLRVGNLDSTRDFLDVEDVVEAYLALSRETVPAGAYNVASGRAVRVGDALDAILRLAGVAPRIEVEPARLRPTDSAAGDASRLRAATGWAPRVPFEETLARVVADWRARASAP
jgi:GDP-4-dehydro-6-deoxy-D-mannose reductase